MAKVTVVPALPPIPPPPSAVHIELTWEEARGLRTHLGNGNTADLDAKKLWDLLMKLNDVGVARL